MKTFKRIMTASVIAFGVFFSSVSFGSFKPIVIAENFSASDFPATVIETMESKADENEVDFMKRVAQRLVAFGAETNHEACGMIGRKIKMISETDGVAVYGVTLVTYGSHVFCYNNEKIMPAGYTSIGKTIHCHGSKDAFQVNKVDFAVGRADNRALSVFKLHERVIGRDLNRFSEQDLLGAPGYLAAPNHLLYHDSTGKVTTIDY